MVTPSPEIVTLLTVFAGAMTAPTFAKATQLVCGAILAPGKRTVSAVLQVLGLAKEDGYGKYHRVLNRDRWSPWVLSHLLLELVIRTFLDEQAPLILLMDETLERRRSDQIRYVGCFRDSARSGLRHLVTSFGIRWICLAVAVPVPWSRRRWALPFMVVPVRSKRVNAALKRPHRTLTDWAQRMVTRVRRWQPTRRIILVADRSYASVAMVQCCQRLPTPVAFLSNLRIDAGLYDPPVRRSKFGPPPKKGPQQPTLADRLIDPATLWQSLTLDWYGGTRKTLQVLAGQSLWSRSGTNPVPISWVLVRCPDDPHFRPGALFCSDTHLSAADLLGFYLLRWNIEVTFEELRAHLGLETQRQWSDRAIERTTPCLFGLFSLVTVLAQRLHPQDMPIHTTAWYAKPEVTFADALAAVRAHLWHTMQFSTSLATHDMALFPQALIERLTSIACLA